MTKRQLEKAWLARGCCLEARRELVEDSFNGNWFSRWIVRPDTVGSCMARDVSHYRSLAEVEEALDRAEIMMPLDEMIELNAGHRRQA
jgi:hypothetical protein